MSSGKGPKRLFELESNASDQQEASNNDTDREESKRQRTALGSAGDDFEEFVALLDRIQYMKTKRAHLRISNAISIPAEDLNVKVSKTKSPWMPSFEWEDFCISSAKDTMSAQTDICSPPRKENPSTSEEKGKQSITPANHLETPSFSSDAYDNRLAKSFDLNVEALS
jgi:hypothetical protein